jgi:aminomethyltransferase
MNLYGQDMDETVGPLESGLGWTVAWEPNERDFIGRPALMAQRYSPERPDFVGLLLTGPRGAAGPSDRARGRRPGGEVTSGGFSPTLERSIALARVQLGLGRPARWRSGASRCPARVVKPPFVRHGQPRSHNLWASGVASRVPLAKG